MLYDFSLSNKIRTVMTKIRCVFAYVWEVKQKYFTIKGVQDFKNMICGHWFRLHVTCMCTCMYNVIENEIYSHLEIPGILKTNSLSTTLKTSFTTIIISFTSSVKKIFFWLVFEYMTCLLIFHPINEKAYWYVATR